MALRYLLYLRAVLGLTLILAVAYCPELHMGLPLSVMVLIFYGLFHASLGWLLHTETIPPDWSLYASLLDVGAITLIIYTTTGLEINLYVAYFVVVIGALLMESLVMSFLVAGVACAFYGVTAVMEPGAVVTVEKLLPFVLLLVSSFFITYLGALVREKRRAVEKQREQRGLWEGRLASNRRLLGELGELLEQPLSKLAAVADGIPDKTKAGEIGWEIEAVRGHLGRIGKILEADKSARAPMELTPSLERAVFRLQKPIHLGEYELDVKEFPRVQILGSKDHVAELFHGVLKDALRRLPAKSELTLSSSVASTQWWERGENVGGWLVIELEGCPGKDSRARGAAGWPAPAGSDIEAAEWILVSHGGRLDRRPEPGEMPLRYRMRLPLRQKMAA